MICCSVLSILLEEFTDEEIKQGLDSIGNLKAPGDDGMPAIFHKNFWDTIGADVTREVRNYLEGGTMPDSWNNTVVVLIPKVQNPERLKDLRRSVYAMLYIKLHRRTGGVEGMDMRHSNLT